MVLQQIHDMLIVGVDLSLLPNEASPLCLVLRRQVVKDVSVDLVDRVDLWREMRKVAIIAQLCRL